MLHGSCSPEHVNHEYFGLLLRVELLLLDAIVELSALTQLQDEADCVALGLIHVHLEDKRSNKELNEFCDTTLSFDLFDSAHLIMNWLCLYITIT